MTGDAILPLFGSFSVDELRYFVRRRETLQYQNQISKRRYKFVTTNHEPMNTNCDQTKRNYIILKFEIYTSVSDNRVILGAALSD